MKMTKRNIIVMVMINILHVTARAFRVSQSAFIAFNNGLVVIGCVELALSSGDGNDRFKIMALAFSFCRQLRPRSDDGLIIFFQKTVKLRWPAL